MKEFLELIDDLKDRQQAVLESARFTKVKEILKKHFLLQADDNRYTKEQLSKCITIISLIPADKVPDSIRTEDIVYYIEQLKSMLEEIEMALAA